jgi:hypothetical protein
VRVVQATDGEHVGEAEVFTYAARLAMGLALLRAQQFASEPIQLAVWDGRETADQAGTFADIRIWQSHGLKTVTLPSEGNLTAKPVLPRPERRSAPRQVCAIMFGDFHGFSRLTDRQMLTFYDHVMTGVAKVLDKHERAIATRNTWGDGLFVVFSDLAAAARCALDIQSAMPLRRICRRRLACGWAWMPAPCSRCRIPFSNRCPIPARISAARRGLNRARRPAKFMSRRLLPRYSRCNRTRS